jgi:hypothetical protein
VEEQPAAAQKVEEHDKRDEWTKVDHLWGVWIPLQKQKEL